MRNNQGETSMLKKFLDIAGTGVLMVIFNVATWYIYIIPTGIWWIMCLISIILFVLNAYFELAGKKAENNKDKGPSLLQSMIAGWREEGASTLLPRPK